MPKITQYTRETLPTQLNQGRRATADDFGGNQAGLMAEAQAAQDTANAMADTSQKIVAVEQKRRNRIDTINVARMADSFYNEAFNEYNRALSEDDIVDPSTADKFNTTIREKSAALLSNFSGSPEARARLEMEVMGQASQFTRQMTQTSVSAQREFIVSKAGDKISFLASQVRENPASFNEIMQQADMVVKEFSPALYAEDELAVQRAAREQVSLSALNSYVDRGMYEDANTLIDTNPAILENLQPETQRMILNEINTGIRERDKAVEDVKKKINVIKTAAEELGVDVPGSAIFSAATGVNNAQTPSAKIAEFERMIGEEATPSVIAKIGFGVDLPEVDHNKEFVGENLTIKGIGMRIKQPYEAAAASVIFLEKVKLQADEFLNTGNSQAGLAAMISFNKMIDDGGVVREGDLKISAQGNSALDNLQLMMDRVGKGGIATPEQVRQMKESAEIFTKSVLDASKAYIDPYLLDAQKRGYRMLDIGIPKESYARVFGTDSIGDIKPDTPAPAGLTDLSDDELQRMLSEMVEK